MRPEFFSAIKRYAIFALVDHEQEYAYIGSSTSSRLSAVYSRHIHGGSAVTRDTFCPNNKPALHLLEIVHCTGSEAYKHILAWIPIFWDAGYCCLNHNKTLDQADEPFKDTAALIGFFQEEPFSEMLSRTHIVHPVDVDKILQQYSEPTPVEAEPDPVAQMNVRMHEKDKERFNTFCRSLSLNQREGFSLLLDQTVKNQEHLHDLLHAKQEKLEQLQEENTKLRDKISILSGEKTDPTVEKYHHRLSLLNYGITSCMPQLTPNLPYLTLNLPQLKPISTHRFMKSTMSADAYYYPEKEGHMEIFLDAIVWSKSRSKAMFVLGTTADRKKKKFRYYPQKGFIGYHFGDCPYFYSGARCLLIYMRAKDGAMDLIAALPIMHSPSTATDTKAIVVQECSKPLRLDDRIKRIEKK